MDQERQAIDAKPTQLQSHHEAAQALFREIEQQIASLQAKGSAVSADERQAIEAKLNLADNYVALMKEASERTRTAAQAVTPDLQPQLNPAPSTVDDGPRTPLEKASWTLGRMLGWLAVFVTSMIVGWKMAGGTSKYGKNP